jgi:hypothetical protein
MIDISSLKLKNTFIATVPRTASTYLNQSIKKHFENFSNFDKNYGEFIFWPDDFQKEFIENSQSKEKFVLAKVMLDHHYIDWQKKHNFNFWKNCQLIILYPRKDYLSHYTSMALPLAKNHYENISPKNKNEIIKSGTSWWNISEGESTRESVKNHFEDMPKISNKEAVWYMNEMLKTIKSFKNNINNVESFADEVLKTSYDEIFVDSENTKETLIWEDPMEKLRFFEDPDFVIDKLNSEVVNNGGWITL